MRNTPEQPYLIKTRRSNDRSKLLDQPISKKDIIRGRKYLNFSQSQIAAIFQVSRQAWRSWEREDTIISIEAERYLLKALKQADNLSNFNPERLKTLRLSLTLNQSLMALTLNLSQSEYSRLESGKKPFTQKIQEILTQSRENKR